MASKSDIIRVAVLGTAGNGKTALIVKLLSGRFIWNYDPTLEAVYKHKLLAEDSDSDFHLEIMDTAGFTSATDGRHFGIEGCVRWAEAFILVYSIIDHCSFLELKNLKDEINEHKKLGASIAIVANKSDLSHHRQVEMEEAMKYANDNGCLFYELSAKTDNKLISELFYDVCRDVKMKRLKEGVKLRRRSSASRLLRKLIQKKLSI